MHLNDFDNLQGMVVNVAQVGPHFRFDDGAFSAVKFVGHLPQGPHDATEDRQLSLYPVDRPLHAGTGIIEDELLQLLQPLAIGLKDREEVIHHRIQQGVEKIVDAESADPGAITFQSLSNRPPNITRKLLEGQNGFLEQEYTHLLLL